MSNWYDPPPIDRYSTEGRAVGGCLPAPGDSDYLRSSGPSGGGGGGGGGGDLGPLLLVLLVPVAMIFVGCGARFVLIQIPPIDTLLRWLFDAALDRKGLAKVGMLVSSLLFVVSGGFAVTGRRAVKTRLCLLSAAAVAAAVAVVILAGLEGRPVYGDWDSFSDWPI